jgi:hypothetical protein
VEAGEENQRVIHGDRVEVVPGGQGVLLDLVPEPEGGTSDDPLALGRIRGLRLQHLQDLPDALQWRRMTGGLKRSADAGQLEVGVRVDESGYHDLPGGIELGSALRFPSHLGGRPDERDSPAAHERRLRLRLFRVHRHQARVHEREALAGCRLPSQPGRSHPEGESRLQEITAFHAGDISTGAFGRRARDGRFP